MNFREIVAQLSYSPTMIWHLASYANQLRIEKKRSLKIVIFCVLNIVLLTYAMVVNKLDNFNSFVPKGIDINSTVSSLSPNLLINSQTEFKNFNQDEFISSLSQRKDLIEIYKLTGLSIESIRNFELVNNYTPTQPCYEISRHSFRNDSQKLTNSKTPTLYASKCLKQYYGLTFVGSQGQNPFVILNNGNLLMNRIPVVDNTISMGELTIDVVNLTTHKQNPSVLSTNQTIKYNFLIKNTTSVPLSRQVEVDLSDLIDQAQVLSDVKTSNDRLLWEINKLSPNEAITKELTIQIGNLSSAKSININDPESKDCKLSLRADNSLITTDLNCPTQKKVNDLLTLNTPTWFIANNSSALFIIIACFGIIAGLKIIRLLEISVLERSIKAIRYNINQGVL